MRDDEVDEVVAGDAGARRMTPARPARGGTGNGAGS
jgi:hypothetical protein